MQFESRMTGYIRILELDELRRFDGDHDGLAGVDVDFSDDGEELVRAKTSRSAPDEVGRKGFSERRP